MVVKTRDRLLEILDEQLYYLHSSSSAFDQGHRHEAKRLAVTIRTLLHDTSMSRSLLGQLAFKNQWLFMDTAGSLNMQNPLPLMPFLMMRSTVVDDQGRVVASYEPMLDDGPPRPGGYAARPFEEWWTMLVVRDGSGEIFSRKDLVMALANKEGGAHIDPHTQDRIAALAAGETLGWMIGDVDGERAVEDDPILPCVRQIAFELLETIRCRQLIPEFGGA